MYSISHPYPPGRSFQPPRQNKCITQRQYREKEGECITTLRDVIKELTGMELQRRKDILAKAIDLLKAVSDIRRQREAQGDSGASHDQCDNFIQSETSYEFQTGEFYTEHNIPSVYYATPNNPPLISESNVWFGETCNTQYYSQQYHVMSSLDVVLHQPFQPIHY